MFVLITVTCHENSIKHSVNGINPLMYIYISWEESRNVHGTGEPDLV